MFILNFVKTGQVCKKRNGGTHLQAAKVTPHVPSYFKAE
jgi:hypothetical protein